MSMADILSDAVHGLDQYLNDPNTAKRYDASLLALVTATRVLMDTTRQRLDDPARMLLHAEQRLATEGREILNEQEPDPDACTNPGGHSWAYTGTAYGGDDERWCGEGRCYCEHCGADGDA